MRFWLLAPVRERMGGECPCPSTGTPWAASRTASTVTWWLLPDVRVGSSRHSRRSLWRGCGCIRSSLAAVPTCSASRSVRRPPVGDSIALRSRDAAHNTPDKEILLPGERRVLHSLRRACRASASVASQSAALSSSVSSVCHTVSCSATSLLSIERIRDCCKKEQPEVPCRLTERGACGAADRADALLR